jgi:hypothetical protein
MPYAREALAWAAGFYEGEGTVNACYSRYTSDLGERRQRKTPQFQLRINQVGAEPLIKFMEAVGTGKVYGPYARTGVKDQYQYDVHSFEKVQAIIAMLWPWLSDRRREQARAVLTSGKR